MVYIAADHGGFTKKQLLVAWLRRSGQPVIDLGPARLTPTDDYPIWAARLARTIQQDRHAVGVVVCRSGVGMALVANKFEGVRAVQGWSSRVAQRSRRDEKTNVLSLASDFQSITEMKRIVRLWLKQPYRPIARYQRRLREISRIEHAR
ncbi:MAG: RpiB/LacA/LacB family sugar-phosphate isomerase [Candidatus Kerfeldbacteria bacterium]|nr:RpiB/LacA/LacB family sugar-phosphate isomerase [Candidatus Kerfeldbacteria bacterium]